MPIKCVHYKKDSSTLYIGRPSEWGNCFTHLPDIAKKHNITLVKDRDEACDRYREWIKTQPHLMARLHELDDEILGCYCKPLRCHGDELIKLREEQIEQEKGINNG